VPVTRKKKKKQSIKLNRTPKVVELSANAASVDVSDLKDEPAPDGPVWAGEGVFTPAVKPSFLAYMPPVRAPFNEDGKQVRQSQMKDYKPSELKWNVVVEASYADLRTLNSHQLTHLYSEGLILDSIYARWAPLAIDNDDITVVAAKDWTEAQALAKSDGLVATYIAKVSYWAAQCVHLLKSTNNPSKVAFIETWAKEICNTPATVEFWRPMEKLYVFLKQTIKTKGSLNRTLMAFKSGQMANWKVKESKADFIARTAKSRQAFWGDQADAYLELWKEGTSDLPDVRPLMTGMRRRFNKLTRIAASAGTAALAAGSTAAGVANQSWAAFLTEKHRLDDITDKMSRLDTLRVQLKASLKGMEAVARKAAVKLATLREDSKLVTWRSWFYTTDEPFSQPSGQAWFNGEHMTPAYATVTAPFRWPARLIVNSVGFIGTIFNYSVLDEDQIAGPSPLSNVGPLDSGDEALMGLTAGSIIASVVAPNPFAFAAVLVFAGALAGKTSYKYVHNFLTKRRAASAVLAASAD